MKNYRFKIPFEHGAWWSFYTVLVGSLVTGLWISKAWLDSLALVATLSAGFLAQDWGQALLSAMLRRRSQAVSQWQAWQGWGLALLSVSAIAFFILRQEQVRQSAWLGLFALLAFSVAVGLAARNALSNRGRKSLAVTALLLAGPALPFGVLCFGFSFKAAAFSLWPALYFPVATLAAQSFIRGFPQAARWLGPLLAAALAVWIAGLGAWAAAGLLALQAGQLHLAIRNRWRDFPQGLPPGRDIRRFGKIQAFYGAGLTALWAVWFISHSS